MGSELLCKAECDGRALEGKALLESEELLFRPIKTGGQKERIRLLRSEIHQIEITDDWLVVKTQIESPKELRLCLGKKEAEKWKLKLLQPKSLFDKLGIRPGVSIYCHGLSKAFIEEALQSGAIREKSGADAKLLFFQADSINALKEVPELRLAMAKDSGLWVIYPKGIAAIRETDVRKAGLDAGLKDIKVCRFSETHTALKFVLPRS